MVSLPDTKNRSLKTQTHQGKKKKKKKFGGSGDQGDGQGRRGAEQDGLGKRQAGSHTYTPSGLRLDTRGFCRLRGCPRNCLAVGRGGDSSEVRLWPDGDKAQRRRLIVA